MGLAFGLGLISEVDYLQYLAAPTPIQDAVIGALVNTQLLGLGYDPIGLEGSDIPGTFAFGGPVVTHAFGWTEFDIAPGSKQLTVTTYGIEPYTFKDVLADPASIAARVPQPVSRLVVNAVDVPCIADFGGDGAVSGSDLAALLGAWGSADPDFDLDGSGLVNGGDLAVLLATWGSCD